MTDRTQTVHNSPLSEEEQVKYEAARRSIVEARSARPPAPALSDEGETLATVRGHLEGYADVLAIPRDLTILRAICNEFVTALREDAEKLEALSPYHCTCAQTIQGCKLHDPTEREHHA